MIKSNFKNLKHLLLINCMILFGTSCADKSEKIQEPEIRLITLDPGHFHSALIQKSMYPEIDSVVHVYAPYGDEVKSHLNLISSYNKRAENPTKWNQKVYTGDDYLTRMFQEKAGNVVVIAGNNKFKTNYIKASVDSGLNVLADKPMAIDTEGFNTLVQAFESAEKNKVLLYDIMTERYEINSILQKEFAHLPAFGELDKGSPENPSVTKISVHHFYKYVSGSVLTRPAWFMDVTQAGEGVVDVTTHLVDLVQWECFPEQTLDYTKDIELISATRTATDMTQSEFTAITKVESFPDYLKSAIVNDSILRVYCNGEINYKLRGVHAKVSVTWAYKAPEGAGDTHYSIMRGTLANLIIRQGAEQQYKPTLYIEPLSQDPSYEQTLTEKMKSVAAKYPGVEVKKIEKGWEVIIPEKYKEGHEAHVARVMEKFLEYLKNRNMPDWEVPNMLAKYYTTTKALELAQTK